MLFRPKILKPCFCRSMNTAQRGFQLVRLENSSADIRSTHVFQDDTKRIKVNFEKLNNADELPPERQQTQTSGLAFNTIPRGGSLQLVDREPKAKPAVSHAAAAS